VRDAMVFALDHADCAAEVVDILTEALTLDETPIPTKVSTALQRVQTLLACTVNNAHVLQLPVCIQQVSRLFLASDILHNSTAPVRNASRYRARLEDALPAIFESLQQTYRNAPGRMAQVNTIGSLLTRLALCLCSSVVLIAHSRSAFVLSCELVGARNATGGAAATCVAGAACVA
jgi:hypothetical protein